MAIDTLILALLGLPLLASALVLLLRDKPDLRDGQALLIGVITAACAVRLYASAETDTVHFISLAAGLDISFTPEPLGKLFALVAGVLWPVATLYTIGYMRGAGEANHTRFMFFYAIAIHAAMGIALSGNLLTLFVFYEILTFSTYPLVTHKGTPEAMRAGRIYLGILVASSVVLLLFGVIGVWVLTGTLEFKSGGILAGHIDPFYVPFLLALFAFGIGKAALMPLHRWLPAAMVAPTPVSALLHAVAVVKAGVFTVLESGGVYLRYRFSARDSEQRLAGLCRQLLHPRRVGRRHDQNQFESAAGLFDHQPARLYCAGCQPRDLACGIGRGAAHRGPCGRENHLVFLRRCDLCGASSDRH
jgi:multicomponent Na+:H+ antiporter subunit D